MILDKEKIELDKNNLALDGFLLSPKIIDNLRFYFCGIRGYKSEDFSARWSLVRAIRHQMNYSHIICEGEYIVSPTPLSDSVVESHKLTPVDSPNSKKRIDASRKLLLQLIMKGYSLSGYRVNQSKVRSREPLEERDVFRQYLQYDPKIICFGDRYVLRPNAKCVYERTDSCLDMMNEGDDPRIGSNLRYRYQPRTCILREITKRTISEPLDDSGTTLLEWYEEKALGTPSLRRYLPIMRQNPNMLVLEVDHDYFNQGKNTKRFSVAAILLSNSITLDDIPDTHRRAFMKNSHVGMEERMKRCVDFLEGLDSSITERMITQPVSPQLAGLSSMVISEANLEFGDGTVVYKWDPVANFRSLLRHRPYRLPKGNKKIGVVPFESKKTDFQKTVKDTISFLKKMGCNVDSQFMDSWSLDQRDRANQFLINDQFGSSEYDALMVELDKWSKQDWNSWKRALVPSGTPSQMVTREKLSTYGAPFNLALGLLSALGGLPYGLAKSYTGVQVWIGMDTWREGRKNIAAASVACDANGLFIGYPNPVVTAGERTDDKAFEEQLRIMIEGVLHRYEQLNQEPPTNFGLIRDGRFFENSQIITLIEKEYNIDFIICDVQKYGAPKLSKEINEEYCSAKGGTILWNEQQGYIQTTEQKPGKNTGTPNLISVGLKKGEVPMEDLLKDLFWLTNIHAGSTQQPGIPFPQYIAHIVAEQAGQGMAFNSGFHTNLGIL